MILIIINAMAGTLGVIFSTTVIKLYKFSCNLLPTALYNQRKAFLWRLAGIMSALWLQEKTRNDPSADSDFDSGFINIMT